MVFQGTRDFHVHACARLYRAPERVLLKRTCVGRCTRGFVDCMCLVCLLWNLGMCVVKVGASWHLQLGNLRGSTFLCLFCNFWARHVMPLAGHGETFPIFWKNGNWEENFEKQVFDKVALPYGCQGP